MISRVTAAKWVRRTLARLGSGVLSALTDLTGRRSVYRPSRGHHDFYPFKVMPKARAARVETRAAAVREAVRDATRQAYVLVNDTDRRQGHTHFGSETVVRTIREAARVRGYRLAGTVNTWQDLTHLLRAGTMPVDLVVLNGEGTMHSGNGALPSDLLDACVEIKAQSNCRSALINSHWDLDERHSITLQNFDAVYLRDQASRQRLARHRTGGKISAAVTPDISIAGFLDAFDGSTIARDGGPFVMDSQQPAESLALLEYAQISGIPFFTATGKSQDLIAGQVPCDVGSSAVGPVPRVFRLTDLTLGCGGLVTGRFHGACLGIALDRPVVALRSKTAKIESLFEDAGLGSGVLLPRDFSELAPSDKRTAVSRRWAEWGPDQRASACAFREAAQTRITDMFDDIFRSGPANRRG